MSDEGQRHRRRRRGAARLAAPSVLLCLRPAYRRRHRLGNAGRRLKLRVPSPALDGPKIGVSTHAMHGRLYARDCSPRRDFVGLVLRDANAETPSASQSTAAKNSDEDFETASKVTGKRAGPGAHAQLKAPSPKPARVSLRDGHAASFALAAMAQAATAKATKAREAELAASAAVDAAEAAAAKAASMGSDNVNTLEVAVVAAQAAAAEAEAARQSAQFAARRIAAAAGGGRTSLSVPELTEAVETAAADLVDATSAERAARDAARAARRATSTPAASQQAVQHRRFGKSQNWR